MKNVTLYWILEGKLWNQIFSAVAIVLFRFCMMRFLLLSGEELRVNFFRGKGQTVNRDWMMEPKQFDWVEDEKTATWESISTVNVFFSSSKHALVGSCVLRGFGAKWWLKLLYFEAKLTSSGKAEKFFDLAHLNITTELLDGAFFFVKSNEQMKNKGYAKSREICKSQKR